MLERAAEAIRRVDGEVAVGAVDPIDVFVLPHVESVVLGYLAVVLQGLVAVRLLVGAGEGHVADLQKLRRGKERHVRGVVEERVAKATLVHEHGSEARPLRLDRAGQACRARADHK